MARSQGIHTGRGLRTSESLDVWMPTFSSAFLRRAEALATLRDPSPRRMIDPMARKKPTLSLRRTGDLVDPLQAERFVRKSTDDLPAADRLPIKRPDVQTSESLDSRELPTPGPAAPPATSKSLVYRKRTDDLRRRMTIYLSEDLSRRLRLYAAERDEDYSVVLAEALGALLDRKNVR